MSNAWQYYVLKGISRVVCLLPYSFILAIGKFLGRIYYRLAAKQRKRALQQIQERLQLSEQEAENIIRSLFCKLGQTFLEVMYTPSLTKETIKTLFTIENRHYLEEALAEGNGVVFYTGHVGNWEWLGASLAMEGFPMTSIIRRQPNDQHTRLLNEYRVQSGIEVFACRSAEIVSAAKALKQGKVLGFLADQDAGVDGIFIEFLGKMSATPSGPAVFSKRFKAPVIPAFIIRRAQGGHRIILHPPLRYEDTGKPQEDARRLTIQMSRVLEDTIRRYPDEWIWFQKRWNTKPPAGIERTGEES